MSRRRWREEDARFAAEVQPAHHPALLGNPQDPAQQDPPPRRTGRLQPEAGQEDRRAWHFGEGTQRHQRLSLPRVGFEIANKPPMREVEMEIKQASGIKRDASQARTRTTICTTSRAVSISTRAMWLPTSTP